MYGLVQRGEIIDGHPHLRVHESWGTDHHGMPIMTSDDDTSTWCIKAPEFQFLACGTMRFAVKKEPADHVPTNYFHYSTWKRIRKQFPTWRKRQCLPEPVKLLSV